MTADATAATRPGRGQGRVEVVRSRAMRAMIGPGIPMLYLLATWHGRNRPVMLAVAAMMLAVAAVTWWRGVWVARSRLRSAIQAALMLINIVGSACLTLLDGGVAGPIGPLLPFSLLFYAVMMPPRIFLAAFVLTWVAYWAVAGFGDPAPPGYAVVYTLGVSGVSYICLRHASALVSMRRRLARASRIDPLTRCLNRRGFDGRLEHELAEAASSGEPVTLVMADLDRFKEVNDTYGHQAGDSLLAWTARTMAGQLRPGDAVGRLGGDEFAAVLVGAGPDEARALVERVRAALDDTAPASFGHASYPAEADGLHQLQQLADQRAYADKVSRDRQLPAAMDPSRLDATGGAEATKALPRRERRGRSIINMGLITASDSAVGALYAVLFADGQQHRVQIGVLCALGVAEGLAVVTAANRIFRSRFVQQFMLTSAIFLFCFAVYIPVLTGGVASATGLAMLVPMPLISLAAPMRVAVPILATVAGTYVCVGVLLGAPSPWYVVMHLVGVLTVSVACAIQGRTAAGQRRQLTRLSRSDALTGCLNRRGFEERFTAELALARGTDRTLGLVIFDLDGFKQLNDSAGHTAGDDLLRWVADTLRTDLHRQEAVGRIGGDEFVVVLHPGSPVEIVPAAERLRTALAARTSTSVGTAVLGRDGADFETLYAHADANLYADKTARRGTSRRARRKPPGPPPRTCPAEPPYPCPAEPPRACPSDLAEGCRQASTGRAHDVPERCGADRTA